MTEPRSVVAVVISAGLSAIPVVGGPVQTVFDAIEERTRYRAEITVREIYDHVGGETLLSRIDENPELETLLTQVVEAATRTSMKAKRRLLARAANAAFDNNEMIDPATLMVSALALLEPVHIRALAALARAATSAQDLEDRQRSETMEAASLAQPVPVLAALIQTGAVLAKTMIWGGDGLGSPAETTGHILIHDVSGFGYNLLVQLDDVAEEDAERLAP